MWAPVWIPLTPLRIRKSQSEIQCQVKTQEPAMPVSRVREASSCLSLCAEPPRFPCCSLCRQGNLFAQATDSKRKLSEIFHLLVHSPHIPTAARAGQTQRQEPGSQFWSHTGCQGPKYLSHQLWETRVCISKKPQRESLQLPHHREVPASEAVTVRQIQAQWFFFKFKLFSRSNLHECISKHNANHKRQIAKRQALKVYKMVSIQ